MDDGRPNQELLQLDPDDVRATDFIRLGYTGLIQHGGTVTGRVRLVEPSRQQMRGMQALLLAQLASAVKRDGCRVAVITPEGDLSPLEARVLGFGNPGKLDLEVFAQVEELPAPNNVKKPNKPYGPAKVGKKGKHKRW